MFERILKFFGASSSTAATTTPSQLPAKRVRNLASARAAVDGAIDPGHEVLDREREKIVWADVPHYPAYDQGFPVVPADKLIDTYGETVRKVMNLANFDGAVSRDAIHRILHNYAEYVHALPASYQEHYYGAGGLLKLGLDVGFHSLQGSNGVVFTKESADIRSRAEPRWKMATFIAGLACEVYRTISAMRVTNQKGDEWSPLIQSLTDWLEVTESTRYWVIWVKNDDFSTHKSVVSMIIPHLVDSDILEYVSKERQALLMMFASITSGVRPSDPNPIALLVEKKRFQLVQRDIERNPNKLGRPQIGSHIDPAIIDAIRSLLKTQAWLINQKGSRVWLTKEGCFVAWKQGGGELIRKLSQNDIPGIPSDAETIREIMQAHGIIEKNPSGKIYWQIIPEGSRATVDAVKIAKPALIISDFEAIAAEVKFVVLKENVSEVKETSSTNSTGSAHEPESKPTAGRVTTKKSDDGEAKNERKKDRESKVKEGKLSAKEDRQPELNLSEVTSIPENLAINPDADHFGEVPPYFDSIPPPFSDVQLEDVLPDDEDPKSCVDAEDNPEEREAREFSRLPKPVADLFRAIKKDFKDGRFTLHPLSDAGLGIPFEILENPGNGVGFLAVMTSLSKISALYTPPGQAAKITTIEVDGVQKRFVGVTRIFARSVFGWREG